MKLAKRKKIFALVTAATLALVVAIALAVMDDQVSNTSPSPANTNITTSENIEDTTPVATATVAGSRFVTNEQFMTDKSTYDSNTKVYFFHAAWCPICRGIESEIEADESRIPEDTVFIKADYDSETELRQKYGITYQYTFVQVDNDGNQIAKWSATSLERAIAGIQ